MDGLTDAQKELLTAEELEGLLEDGGSDEGNDDDGNDDDAGDGTEAGGDDGDDGSQQDDDVAGGNADSQADADEDADAGAVAGTGAEAQQQDQTATTQAAPAATNERPPNWILPADHDQQKAAIDQQRDQLTQQFDDGDLTAIEYREALKPLDQKFDALREKEILARIREQTAKEGWRDTVEEFLSGRPLYRDQALQKLLDQEVRELQAKAVNPLKRSILEEADKRLTARLSAALGVKADKTATTPAKTTTKKAARDDPPPSLRKVPAADVDDTDGGEFAYLDRLRDTDSVKYEQELEKLKPDVLDRYMQG